MTSIERPKIRDCVIPLAKNIGLVWNAGGVIVLRTHYGPEEYRLFEVLAESADEALCRPLTRAGQPVILEDFHEACREAFAFVVEKHGITAPELRRLAERIPPAGRRTP